MHKSKKSFYLFIFILFILSNFGCSSVNVKSKYYIQTTSKEFDDYVINNMYRNVLKTDDIIPDEFVELNARQFITDKGEAYYSFILVYRGDKPLNILTKDSIVLIIDNEKYKLDSAIPDRLFVPKKTFREDRVWEEESYKVNTDLIKKIAYAKEVKIKVNGEKRSIICSFKEDNFEAFKEFYEKYATKPEFKPIKKI